jgi:hypothetical protein
MGETPMISKLCWSVVIMLAFWAGPGMSQVKGEKKTHIRPKSEHQVVGPGKCGGCHAHEDESTWWLDDKHSLALEAFFDEEDRNVKIAEAYGVENMIAGNEVCMDCHGAVISGNEDRDVNDGAGCESCHGAGSAYLKPHEEGEKEDGVKRTGYVKALGLGLRELKKADVMAKACVGCHYITDQRLISADHKSGADFDYGKGMEDIKHWDKDAVTPDELRAAAKKVIAARGPVPSK